jgi:hypothetical protein
VDLDDLEIDELLEHLEAANPVCPTHRARSDIRREPEGTGAAGWRRKAMSWVQQTVTLASPQHFGRRVPAPALGEVLKLVPEAVRLSVRMAFEGRSKARGQRPDWLRASSDLRFLGHQGDDETTLCFEAPTLGEAAGRIYEQRESWPTRPAPEDTGFDLLGDVISDVAAQNPDSDRFDPPLLHEITEFGRVLDGTFSQMVLTGRRYPLDRAVVLNPRVVDCARNLRTNTPLPQQVRVVGKLDMVRASTRTLGVILDDGQEVRGVLIEGDITSICGLMNQRVLVLGKAVYRPSGRALRIDAEQVTATTETGGFFSTIPKPARKRFDLREPFREQSGKGGVGAVFGRWPGDETDEEIQQALRDIS